jgi:hypothetical protein
MNNPASNHAGLKLPEWLPESMRDDPKKAGILGVLVLVLVVLTIRYFLIASGGPAAAQGATTPRKSDKPKPAESAKAQQPTIATASGVTRAWLAGPITSVSRNLFEIRQEYYPSQASKVERTESKSDGFWDAIEKSRSREADLRKRREILVENLQREAAKLRLQSTVMGPEPQAIIGGSLVKEGDVVASDGAAGSAGVQFRVLRIEARRVIVEREGIKLEIRMQQ